MTGVAVASNGHGTEPSGRIPSLDGLRAISVALVVASHASTTIGYPHLMKQAINSLDFGNMGVRVFFVISGFLITRLLLIEHAKRGRISLSRFYLRRTFRIFPPFYAFVAALAAATALGWILVPQDDLVRAITYTVNYRDHGTWYVGHAWSLSVEEQFYLLWPAILVLLGRRRGLRIALAFVAVSPLIRLAYYTWMPSTRSTIAIRFETVADAIAMGCILAMMRDELWANRWYRGILESRWIILVLGAVLLAASLDPHPRISYVFCIPVKNIGILLLIDWCIRNPGGRVGRLLNARPAVFIGVLSYSIYIWQELFLVDGSTATITRFPLNIAAVGAVALASFYAIERPAMRARARLEGWLDLRAATQGKQVPAGELAEASSGHPGNGL